MSRQKALEQLFVFIFIFGKCFANNAKHVTLKMQTKWILHEAFKLTDTSHLPIIKIKIKCYCLEEKIY